MPGLPQAGTQGPKILTVTEDYTAEGSQPGRLLLSTSQAWGGHVAPAQTEVLLAVGRPHSALVGDDNHPKDTPARLLTGVEGTPRWHDTDGHSP